MTARDRVGAAYRRIEKAGRPEVWITVRAESDALADADALDARLARGERLPLAGLTVAVKDNVDVAGLPTTAGCPAFAYSPERSAPAVARLVAAGAVVIGKTNLDQFATGLSGTRSPFGAVRDVLRPDRVSGGSSSGSAVAVALGIADLGVGTDTAGSGRVPAAFQGIVGIKPTLGLIPTRGVVPACRTLDCVTVFARGLATAEAAAAVMAAPPGRLWPADAPLAAPPHPRVGVPRPGQLPELGPAAVHAYARATERLADAGAELVEIDLEPFREAASMLYEGAFVAERYAAVGEFVARESAAVEPSVAAIITAAGSIPAHALVNDGARLELLRARADAELERVAALLLPTAPAQPTIAAVQADPIAANSRLGVYTNFANLLDLCAVAVPAGDADGGHFGVTVFAPAFADRVAGDVARMLLGDRAAAPPGPPSVRLFVVGAHLSGQPLNGQLTGRGGRLIGPAQTARRYRLHRLATDPPKPGLVRAERGGAAVAGELWELPPAGIAALLAELPAPMALGRVSLEGGATSVGFLCEPAALAGAPDITEHGSWPAYLESSGGGQAFAATARRSSL